MSKSSDAAFDTFCIQNGIKHTVCVGDDDAAWRELKQAEQQAREWVLDNVDLKTQVAEAREAFFGHLKTGARPKIVLLGSRASLGY